MLDKVGALGNLSLTSIALILNSFIVIREMARFEKIFLAIHAFGLRCFKVLDKIGALDNFSLTAIALTVSSIQSDHVAGLV